MENIKGNAAPRQGRAATEREPLDLRYLRGDTLTAPLALTAIGAVAVQPVGNSQDDHCGSTSPQNVSCSMCAEVAEGGLVEPSQAPAERRLRWCDPFVPAADIRQYSYAQA